MDECIFETSFANVLIQVEDEAVIQLSFTKRKAKATKNPFLMDVKKQIIQYIAGKKKRFTFKANPEGTCYQKKVWKELQKIPYGESVYYSSIANKIQSSPRAVGNACGANKCLLIIPCHRVISKNINGSGFSSFGRLIHKNRLLNLEN
ncbi:MAG: methylated-DNA--[protein]-cysteine S-methyltransferase [Gammaproteobacteria bacterium]|jgi:methylated-DNA-[protein]-cysteine S-methyltransferase|nr:methylated-DNA--[protein]-cysteine S-methyltransferase [Gammaproteobacteria bacterium]MBT4655300.1 methylated-DNA--[protein]-cysteine S-methyltransferase [Gammaproteobacteria bacterium]MBT5117226.1 methylated-DNA--[protein]-cysteine S-methyltransferase [Gammaproteobacteria bacterium]MBT6331690.1 methylated-DNA--[protein]-cysteine S-methyltransferase [Gammaproteobacteria bacterium]